MKSTPSIDETIIHLFCIVDDLLKLCSQKPIGMNKGGRPKKLSNAELLTFALLEHVLHFPHKKACYRFLSSYCRRFFPHLPEYSNYVLQTNAMAPDAAQLLLLCCAVHRHETYTEQYVDSTPLPVCKNKRIVSHKVCKDIATRSKSSTGWFYGFKLHAVCNPEGQLLSVRLTTGSVDDRSPLLLLLKDLSGLVVGDAGYLSKELQEKLQENNVHLFTAVRTNMKKLMTAFQHTVLKRRQRIESVFSVLKERMGMVSSLSRSVKGHFARYIATLLAYCLKPLAEQQLRLS